MLPQQFTDTPAHHDARTMHQSTMSRRSAENQRRIARTLSRDRGHCRLIDVRNGQRAATRSHCMAIFALIVSFLADILFAPTRIGRVHKSSDRWTPELTR